MENQLNLAKTVHYMLNSYLITFLVAYYVTGQLVVAAPIGFVGMGVKIVYYYLFDGKPRRIHNLNTGYISPFFEKQGNIVVVSLFSLYDDIRNEVRNRCGNMIEIYASTDLERGIKRDPKGVYKKAQTGAMREWTGASAPYHPPIDP